MPAGDTGKIQGRCRGGTGEMQGRYRGDAGEVLGRCRGDAGEMQGRYRRCPAGVARGRGEVLLLEHRVLDPVAHQEAHLVRYR